MNAPTLNAGIAGTRPDFHIPRTRPPAGLLDTPLPRRPSIDEVEALHAARGGLPAHYAARMARLHDLGRALDMLDTQAAQGLLTAAQTRDRAAWATEFARELRHVGVYPVGA